MEAILEFTAQEAARGTSSRLASSSTAVNGDNTYERRQELNGRMSALDAELKDVKEQISDLQDLQAQILAEKQNIDQELKTLNGSRLSEVIASSSGKGKGKAPSGGAINYMTEAFEWSGELKARMREVFSIQSFRLCQEGVCNANMDGRDIVCIMPTGGGKSLTYQLPGLLNPGCTLVISPLISLITDQILHLHEFGVEAVMLMGSTSKEESRDIYSRLAAAANPKANRNGAVLEIKFCYVTPEKIAKSKSFTSMLEKLANAGKLSRIVIDEAHCVSQLGHDFRPDYKKLSILRQLFPRVPILALSATCPPKVLKDLLLTLRLKPVVSGTAASADGTVYFSAPLYRKNLHYRVVPKPSSSNGLIKAMSDYILNHHQNDSGIVYCMSKKDTEAVAEGLSKESGGKIRTGVYHADIHDRDKANLHERWRRGEVKVVCATIAFGLGIDKGDVRFVLHHSKSLEGYYQESGRAGRDGRDSDCLLYFRPQDASRLSALVCGELEGQGKLRDILRFAVDVEECRKLQFARYFSTSASLSMSAWGTAETDAHARCGHCDNCTRPPESVERRDVTFLAWQILRVVQAVEQGTGRVTLGMLADLVRGAGGGAFGVASGKRGRGKAKDGLKEKVELDLEELSGGKVSLGKDDTEFLILHLLLSGHLKESFHSTAYSINVYVTSGPGALRLARYSKEDVESGRGQRIEVAFLKKGKEAGKKNDKCNKTGGREASRILSGGAKGKKRKRGEESSDDEYWQDHEHIGQDNATMSLYADGDDLTPEPDVREAEKTSALYRAPQNGTAARRHSQIAEANDREGWSFNMGEHASSSTGSSSTGRPQARFKPSVAPQVKAANRTVSSNNEVIARTPLTKFKKPLDDDVIEIISDSE
ncbi:ATP-dependent DNA helicase [Fomitiporia mediterranea MF3/22]|uniref:ATP-dependent DNA helicase n=1 Tax=Fomitiporia mediterranea (strain MF3/22) TaxID=694068 RepID=UPI0004408B28|nr:ATP-dependent DNA helicase [Fomitiporia mediterranea MF3/22]EJD05581.1 ATP-dependent DNA helicase [Fomitiporia mediterranea MF3/22]